MIGVDFDDSDDVLLLITREVAVCGLLLLLLYSTDRVIVLSVPCLFAAALSGFRDDCNREYK